MERRPPEGMSESDAIDALLVLESQLGDRGCLDLLVCRWQERIGAMVAREFPADAPWDDACQDVWLAIARGLVRLDDPARFGAWARGIVRRRAADWVRRATRERRMRRVMRDRSAEGGPAPLHARSDSDEIARAVEALSGETRTIVMLFYRDGLGVVQIAEIAQVPVGTVKSRLFAARREIRRVLVAHSATDHERRAEGAHDG